MDAGGVEAGTQMEDLAVDNKVTRAKSLDGGKSAGSMGGGSRCCVKVGEVKTKYKNKNKKI